MERRESDMKEAITHDSAHKKGNADRLDRRAIIRLQPSLIRSSVALLTVVIWGLVLWWQDVAMVGMLPFLVLAGYIGGARERLTVLKSDCGQWWQFQKGQWLPVTLTPIHVGTWCLVLGVDDVRITVWPDSCNQQHQWRLRCALLARQRAQRASMPPPGRWGALWRMLLR